MVKTEMMVNPDATNQRIKQLRIQRGMKQEELAAALNLTQQNISDIENGKRKIYDDLITRMARFFEVSTDYLLGMTDEKEYVRNGLNEKGISNERLIASTLEMGQSVIQESASFQAQNAHKIASGENIAKAYNQMDNLRKAMITSVTDCLLDFDAEEKG